MVSMGAVRGSIGRRWCRPRCRAGSLPGSQYSTPPIIPSPGIPAARTPGGRVAPLIRGPSSSDDGGGRVDRVAARVGMSAVGRCRAPGMWLAASLVRRGCPINAKVVPASRAAWTSDGVGLELEPLVKNRSLRTCPKQYESGVPTELRSPALGCRPGFPVVHSGGDEFPDGRLGSWRTPA